MYFEKIIELIVILLQELRQNKQFVKSDIEKLAEMGYTQNEINTAFSWIYTKFNQVEKIFDDSSTKNQSHRFLHEVEKNVISSDAYGYLIQLRELGLLNDYDIEVIIEKVMLSGYIKIKIQDIKMIVCSHLLDLDEKTNFNKRISFNTNDTVN